MSSSMGRIIPYMKWKIKFMFQTTNQFGTWWLVGFLLETSCFELETTRKDIGKTLGVPILGKLQWLAASSACWVVWDIQEIPHLTNDLNKLSWKLLNQGLPTILTHPSQLQWRHVMTWPPCEPSNEERCSCHPILSTTECSNPCAEFHGFPCWASGMGSCPKHLMAMRQWFFRRKKTSRFSHVRWSSEVGIRPCLTRKNCLEKLPGTNAGKPNWGLPDLVDVP